MTWKWFACVALASLSAGCPSADIDENEVGAPPTVEFDPANKIIPFPNNLLLDPATGKLALPATCNPNGGPESPTAQQLREGVLNQLDGFGTWKPTLNVTFTEPVDMASLADHVFLYKIAAAGSPLDPSGEQAIPVTPIATQTARFDADCQNPALVDQVTFVPNVPLDGNSTYVLGLTEGVTTAEGVAFEPSFTWRLVREADPVVSFGDDGSIVEQTPLDPGDPDQLAQLQGIDLLWNAHQGPLAFLAAKGQQHQDVLIAFAFNTQTVADPLDPAVSGSPAAEASATPALVGVQRVNAQANGEQFLNAALPGQCAPNGPLPCAAVGEVLAGGLLTKQYQLDTPNPFDATKPIPGPWDDPLHPTVQHEGLEGVVGVLITTAKDCPAEGCPTVVFGHGLGSSKTTLLAIAAQLASQGFNAVAIDWVAHDSRAVRISDQGDCAGDPAPTELPQCFAPFLSPNLAATRDNIRQSIVDLHALVASIKACGVDGCNTADGQVLSIDAEKIEYVGISLGGILGSLGVATQGDFNAAVLNVPAVSLVDILENTQTLAIRCSLVDGLIDAGILVGDKFDETVPSGLCLGEEWKTQPGYLQFAVIGRWVLDPADAVNFTGSLAQRRVLIQEVVDDQVVPNVATEIEAALLGLTGQTADPQISAVPDPSDAIVSDASLFLRYPTLPGDADTGFPGNTFDHPSLLRPTPVVGGSGALGTLRLQTDAITFLLLNQ